MNTSNLYSESWKGQDGNMWREVKYWVGNGYRSFLQVYRFGQWEGF